MPDRRHVILYVDDDDAMRQSMRTLLTAHGYELREAASAEAGLHAFRQHRPDFILVDLMMEEVDSGAVLARRLMVAGNRAPVYLLSSVGDQLDASIDFAELGLSGVFQKPIDRETLLRTLQAKLTPTAP